MGAGAVGGTVAARLVRAGVDLAVVDTNEEHVAKLREPGLDLSGEVVPLDARTDVPDGEPDLVLLAVRSDATERAIPAGRLGPRSDVVSLQNGLNEDRIADLVGAERTIGCVVGFGATWIGPGHLTLDAEGPLTIGRLDGSVDERLEHARNVLDLAFPTRVTDDIRGALWGKVLVNSVTVLGALCGMLTGELLADPGRRAKAAAIVREGLAVARAEGVASAKAFGVSDPDRLEGALEDFGRRFGAIRSVTWRDIELGRPTEIDAVTGEVVRRGEALGVRTPLSSDVYGMLREIERGDRRPDARNLA